MPKTDSQYWIRDLSGQYAVTTSPDEWVPREWAVSKKAPRKVDLVWLQHEVTGGKQVFSYAASEQWSALGWHLSEPPAPKDLTKDPVLVDVEDDEVVPADEPEAVSAPAPKKAAASSKKEQ